MNEARRRELAAAIQVNAPDYWWDGEDQDLFGGLVDDLVRLGWTPPTDQSTRREEVSG